MYEVRWTLTFKSDTEGPISMDALQSIKDAVTAQGTAIVAELEQLAQQQSPIDPAEVQALADQIRANTAQIQGFVPDETPTP